MNHRAAGLTGSGVPLNSDWPEALESFRANLLRLAEMWLSPGLRQKVDATDVVQETLLTAGSRLGDFRGTTRAELEAWLRQILVRQVTTLIRQYRVAASRDIRRERSLDVDGESNALPLAERLAGDFSTPSAPARMKELSLTLARALEQLPQDYQDVLRLHSLEELDWPEVAARMNRSVGSVRMLWARALKQIKPLLQSHS